MAAIKQVGTVSECICNGASMLVTEVLWYCFIHVQAERMQLAKPKAIKEAETLRQDHPYSTLATMKSVWQTLLPEDWSSLPILEHKEGL